MKVKSTLKAQLFIGLFVTTFLSLLVMASVQHLRATKNLNGLVEYHLLHLSEQFKQQVTRSVDHEIEHLELIKSQLVGGGVLDPADSGSLYEQASLLSFFERVKNASARDQQLALYDEAFRPIFLPVSDNSSSQSQYLQLDRDDFLAYEHNGQTTLIHLTQSDEEYSLSLMSPVENSGVLVGYLYAQTSIPQLAALVTTASDITSTHDFVLMRRDKGGLVSPLSSYASSTGATSRKFIVNPFEQIEQGNVNSIFEFQDYRGADVVGIVGHIEALNLAYVTKIDQKEAYGLIDDLNHYLYVSALIGVGIVFLVCYLISNKLVGPLERLVTTTNNIVTGNNIRNDVIKSPLELNLLSQSINALADRMQSALSSANLNQEFVLESMLEGVLIIDGNGVIQKANPAIQTILDTTQDELTGTNINRLLKEHDQYVMMGLIYKLLQSESGDGVDDRKQIELIKRDDEIVVASVSLTKLDNSGHCLFLMVVNDITEKMQYQQRLEHLALHDALTNLPKMILASDRLEAAMHGAKRNDKKVGIMFVDLDNFKPINDTHGHATGDLVLKVVAKRAMEVVRKTDTVARIGGDEFIIIVPNIASAQEAINVANKLINSITLPIDAGHAEVSIGMSIGISMYPDCSINKEQLVAMADEAMYQVKAAGRNGVQLFTVEEASDSTVTPIHNANR